MDELKRRANQGESLEIRRGLHHPWFKPGTEATELAKDRPLAKRGPSIPSSVDMQESFAVHPAGSHSVAAPLLEGGGAGNQAATSCSTE